MDPVIGGALIGGVGSAISGLLGNRSSRKQAAAQAALQKEFAQNGITWKVEDAKRAGLHPLAALGAQTVPYQPVTVGQDFSFAKDMGQDISRAMMATADAKQREALAAEQMQMNREAHAANINRIHADTALTEMQTREAAARVGRLSSAQIGPPAPSYRRGGSPNNVGAFVVDPSRITAHGDVESVEAGPPTPGFKKYSIGGKRAKAVIELPGQQMSESLEGTGIAAPLYVWGHNILRTGERALNAITGDPDTRPKVKLPKGYTWRWSAFNQAWQARRIH